MGLLVHTSFETREGVPIESVYARITALTCEFRGGSTSLTIAYETYLNRDRRMQSFAPLLAPTLEYRVHLTTPYDASIGDMTFLYGKIRERLAERGIVADDVLEEGQPPITYSEPEPVPQPSAE